MGAILYPAERQARLGDYVQECVGLRDRKVAKVSTTSNTRTRARGAAADFDWMSVAAKQLNLEAALTGGWRMVTACEHCCQMALRKPTGPTSESCPQTSNPDFPFT